MSVKEEKWKAYNSDKQCPVDFAAHNNISNKVDSKTLKIKKERLEGL